MPYIIGIASQKGGVGKSTIARSLAVYLTKQKYSVKVADMDLEQATFLNWYRRRLQNGVKPAIKSVEPHSNLSTAIKSADNFDILIIDTAGKALADSISLAKICHLLLQPSNSGLDDLEPAVLRFNQLIKKGVPKNKLYVVFSEKGTDSNVREAQEYLEEAGYNYISSGVSNKNSYRNALNSGCALQEIQYKHLSKEALKMLEEIVDVLQKTIE